MLSRSARALLIAFVKTAGSPLHALIPAVVRLRTLVSSQSGGLG